MTVKYVLWQRLKPSGWENSAVFQFEGGEITGMSPSGWGKELAKVNWKTATLLAKAQPDRHRLEELDEATASVSIMETEIMHQKNVLEAGLPAGTYFILWSHERPMKGKNDVDGLDEAAYGRVTKDVGDPYREVVILGVHRFRKGRLDEKVMGPGGETVIRSSAFRFGETYKMTAMNVIRTSKDEIRTLRKVEPDDWSHKPDQDLDLVSYQESEFRRG